MEEDDDDFYGGVGAGMQYGEPGMKMEEDDREQQENFAADHEEDEEEDSDDVGTSVANNGTYMY